MKDKFQGYYKKSTSQIEELWSKAVFVFDTNCLLNLYRYPLADTRSMLELMKEYSNENRVWIPYQVGLEYQRNRLGVVEAQYKRFDEVKQTIQAAVNSIQSALSERHTLISKSDSLIEKFTTIQNEFITDLDALSKTCLKPDDHDLIREQLDAIFTSKVGDVPSQQMVDDVYKDGVKRYLNKIPPGYKDAVKQKGDASQGPLSFSYEGILYDPQYGDLLLWKQLISYAKSDTALKHVIFVTDDTKEDWWEERLGKTVGPRPELVSEIMKDGELESFHMYSTKGFLENAKASGKTKANIATSTIQNVKEVLDSPSSWQSSYPVSVNWKNYGWKAFFHNAFMSALNEYVAKTYPTAGLSLYKGLPFMYVNDDGSETVVTTINYSAYNEPSLEFRDLRSNISKIADAYRNVPHNKISEIKIIIGMPMSTVNEQIYERAMQACSELFDNSAVKVSLTVGFMYPMDAQATNLKYVYQPAIKDRVVKSSPNAWLELGLQESA